MLLPQALSSITRNEEQFVKNLKKKQQFKQAIINATVFHYSIQKRTITDNC